MIEQLSTWWQAIFFVGQPVFPYVGLALLILVIIFLTLVVMYLLWRVIKRMPGYIRYVLWRTSSAFRRGFAFFRRHRGNLHDLSTSFGYGGEIIRLVDSFRRSGRGRNLFGTAVVARRPTVPLVLLLGPDDANKTSLASCLEGREDIAVKSGARELVSDTIWWRLQPGLMLEVSERLALDLVSGKLAVLIEALRRMRPDRPIDGIVLAFPAPSLLGSPDAAEVLVKRWKDVCSAIAVKLGYQVPVEILVTQGETMRGFSSLEKLAQSIEIYGDVLGAQISREPELSAMTWGNLIRTRVDIVSLKGLMLHKQDASGENFPLRDSLYFGSHAEKLGVTVAAFLREGEGDNGGVSLSNQCLVRLRGIYLCGASLERSRHLAFCGEGLCKLIFQSTANLPLTATRIAQTHSRNQLVLRLLAATSVAFILWGGNTAARMKDAIEVRIDVLRQLSDEIQAIQSGALVVSNVDSRVLEKVVRSSFRVDERSLRFVLVPAAWFSDLDERILSVIGEVGQQFLFSPFVQKLAGQEVRLGTMAPTRRGGGWLERRGEENLPGYSALAEFLDSREQIFRLVESADKAATRRKLTYEAFVSLLGFRTNSLRAYPIDWSASMPAEVVQQFKIASAFRDEAETGIRNSLDAHWDQLLNDAILRHPIVLLLEEIDDTVHRISSGDPIKHQLALQLAANLKRLHEECEAKGAKRLLGSESDVQSVFAQALAKLAGASVVSVGHASEYAEVLKSKIAQARERLERREIDGVGLVFSTDGKSGRLILGPEFRRFSSVYQQFVRSSFMQSVPEVKLPSVSYEQFIDWATGDIERLRTVAEAHREFSLNGVQMFDPKLRSGLQRIARRNFDITAESILKESARVGTISSVTGNRSEAFRKIAAQATNLAAAFRIYKAAFGGESGRSDLGEGGRILAREAKGVLERLDTVLVSEDPLAPLANDVVRWIRSAPSGTTLTASLRGDPKERSLATREHLRSRYGVLSSQMIDIIDAVAGEGADDPGVARWRRFRIALEGVERGNMGGSAFEYDRYVISLDKLADPEKCDRFLAERPRATLPDDYFSTALTALDRSVVAGCSLRMTDVRIRKYEEFAAWFNSVAAGRYPFSASTKGPSLGLDGMRRVMSRFAEFRGKREEPGGYALGGETAEFLGHMDDLLAMFSPQSGVIPSPSGTSSSSAMKMEFASEPLVRGKFRFRPRRTVERGAEQIAELAVLIGGRRYSHRQGEPAFEWRPGESIEFQFRWATDSAVMPIVSTTDDEPSSVRGEKSVSFKFSGMWAFVELIRRHRDTAVFSSQECTLVFSIPTVSSGRREDALVEIALVSLDSSKGLPLVFPTHAPLMLGIDAGRGSQ